MFLAIPIWLYVLLVLLYSGVGKEGGGLGGSARGRENTLQELSRLSLFCSVLWNVDGSSGRRQTVRRRCHADDSVDPVPLSVLFSL